MIGQRPQHFGAHPVGVHPELAEDTGTDPFTLTDQPQQDVGAADLAVA